MTGCIVTLPIRLIVVALSLSRGFYPGGGDDAAVNLIRSRKGNDFFLRGFLSVSDWEDKTGCGHTACGLVPCLCFLHGDHLPDKDEDGKHPAKARRGEGTLPVLRSPSIFSIFYNWNNVYRCLLQGTPATAGDVKLTF